MSKVGLISVSIHNYGSLLQTYAMQKVLDNLGVENDIILFKSDPVKQIYRVFNPSFLTIKLKLLNRKVITKVKYPDIYRGTKVRDVAFMEFKEKYCRFTEKTTSREKLDEYGNTYRAFVLGSDQVWNPANLEMNFYTMNFVPEEKTKVAYAPSFGVSKIPEKQVVATRNYLKRIQYISTREIAGARIIKELTGREVPVVCDPTALISREQWDEVKSEKMYTTGKYIFCYFLGSNSLHREFANRVKKETGYTIVALQHIDEFVKRDLTFGDVKPYDVGPQDFINLISNAEIVLTDSFHGTMFSIYYHKTFFTFPRYAEGQKGSTNSRITSILKNVDLGERFLCGNENVKEYIDKPVDWDKAQNKLDIFINTSYNWFLSSIKDGGII